MSRLRKSNSFFLFLLFIIVLLVWMTVQVRSGGDTGFLASPVAPVQRLLTFFTDGLEGMWNRHLDLGEVARENDRLRSLLRDAETKLLAYEELERENERLSSLLAMPPPGEARIVGAARILSWDPAGWTQVALIDKGAGQGSRLDMPVVSQKGLLGRLVGVTENTSRVLLLADTRAAVAVRLEQSRANAILEGTGRNRTRLLYVLQETPVEPGEMVFTSGLDGIFPPKIPVGVVVSHSEGKSGVFQEIEVRPLADIGTVEEVVLLEPYREGLP